MLRRTHLCISASCCGGARSGCAAIPLRTVARHADACLCNNVVLMNDVGLQADIPLAAYNCQARLPAAQSHAIRISQDLGIRKCKRLMRLSTTTCCLCKTTQHAPSSSRICCKHVMTRTEHTRAQRRSLDAAQQVNCATAVFCNCCQRRARIKIAIRTHC